ncbi:polyglutamine-binding protein 1-like [Liolophura sinensis]|uniref:polyglutamine-binding protein 1-like n=1 Tax=Liolophura sinensis TaxID=3198878 RepID=UPI0031585EAD
MPLPAALQARLEKRGIVKRQESKRPGIGYGNFQSNPIEEVEEVFAEDYDDLSHPNHQEAEVPQIVASVPTTTEPEGEEPEEEEVLACPNKWNPHHQCVDYCRQRWGVRTFQPDSNMLRRRDRMLRKYPLPDNWQEVADPETNRYYYWNRITDEVSWLSPIHPKAQITVAAKALQDLLRAKVSIKMPEVEKMDMQEKEANKDTDEEMDFERMEEDLREEKDRRKKDRRGRRRKEEELDPMDPAAYSDVPRGNWSTGLERRGEAKTGADVTASGPLFQQRPYPSPGDILRANRKSNPE